MKHCLRFLQSWCPKDCPNDCREAEFAEQECDLTAEQRACYDAAVQEWQHLRQGVARALTLTGAGRDVWKVFWATQQRFFKLLCVSMKVLSDCPPTVLQ